MTEMSYAMSRHALIDIHLEMNGFGEKNSTGINCHPNLKKY